MKLFTTMPQVIANGEIRNAMVFDGKGKTIATIAITEDPEIANCYAKILASTLNLHLIDHIREVLKDKN